MILLLDQSLELPMVSVLGLASTIFFGLLAWLLTGKVKTMDDSIKKNIIDIEETNKKLNEVNLEILKEINKISVEIAKYTKQ